VGYVQLKNKRSSIQIIADILRLLRLSKAGRTEIMYTINLSFNQRQKYLENLVELGLVEEIHEGIQSLGYRITRNGLDLLTAIDNLQEMLHLEELPDILNSPHIVKANSRQSPTI